MTQYRIEVGDARSHRFVVTMRVSKPMPQQQLSLPVWIPGSYMVREFARHLSPITATQAGRDLTVTQRDKCTWVLDNHDVTRAYLFGNRQCERRVAHFVAEHQSVQLDHGHR